MLVRLKVSAQIETGGKMRAPGSVVEVSKEDGLKMISRGQASALDTGKDMPSADDANVDKLSDEARATAREELLQVKGVTKKNVDAIIDAGYTTITELQEATEEQLAALPNVSAKQAENIVADAAEFVDEDGEGDDEGNEDDGDEDNEDDAE